MMTAYDESYIETAQRTLAQMMHFAVYDLEMSYDDYMYLFLVSGVADQFGCGNPKYIAGMSGTELAREVMSRVSSSEITAEPSSYDSRSDAYWTGHVLAYYQWRSAESFRVIISGIPASAVAGMYRKYHEMDIRQSVDEIDRMRRMAAYQKMVGLQAVRRAAGLSQRQLAEQSGVPLRSIQQYEQRQKDLSKASFRTVLDLARVLKCAPERLIQAAGVPSDPSAG
ncbi:MAG: helix-turn-helix transcriptional regulator [Lachnospiraceae bacterium]|nr:helix-turn-helix transcriptional regulator [Lachnospiraceae bacterium]